MKLALKQSQKANLLHIKYLFFFMLLSMSLDILPFLEDNFAGIIRM